MGCDLRGVARFNGDSFARFDKSSLKGLKRDTILTLFKERDGALWLGTNGGGRTRESGETLRAGVESEPHAAAPLERAERLVSRD